MIDANKPLYVVGVGAVNPRDIRTGRTELPQFYRSLNEYVDLLNDFHNSIADPIRGNPNIHAREENLESNFNEKRAVLSSVFNDDAKFKNIIKSLIKEVFPEASPDNMDKFAVAINRAAHAAVSNKETVKQALENDIAINEHAAQYLPQFKDVRAFQLSEDSFFTKSGISFDIDNPEHLKTLSKEIREGKQHNLIRDEDLSALKYSGPDIKNDPVYMAPPPIGQKGKIAVGGGFGFGGQG